MNLPRLIFTSAALSLLTALTAQNPAAPFPAEYKTNIHNYKFVHTRGMFDLNPSLIPWIPDRYQEKDLDGNTDNWEAPTPAEIQSMKEMGIDFPETGFEGGLQHTHTTEHTIYALPGEAVALYPYYGLDYYKEPDSDNFASTLDYFETFAHWYDWNSGGRPLSGGIDLLDFPGRRKYIQITSDAGFFGGIYMSPDAGKTYEVATPQAYIDAVNAINTPAEGGRGCIVLTADLDFDGLTDVPMLGSDDRPFQGLINGNGHNFSNLKIEKNDHKVGIIRNCADGTAIHNLTLDNCSFSGYTHVGLAAHFTGGCLTVRNVKINDNCTIKGTGSENEHFVGALLGRCESDATDNRLLIENVYIGGTIGNPDRGMNTALCGWLTTKNSKSASVFTNIVVNCTLNSPEAVKREKYIRHSIDNALTDSRDGKIIETGHWNDSPTEWTFIFRNCYGNHNKEGDYTDPCWTPFDNLEALSGKPGAAEAIDQTERIGESIGYPNLGADLLTLRDRRPWDKEEGKNVQPQRQAATSAVFFYPGPGKVPDCTVAADFSQTFHPDTHLDVADMHVCEPIIAFRHLFQIKDATAYADEMQQQNDEWIRRRQHKVSARAGAQFQMRLDNPIPVDAKGKANYFFKDQTGKYRHVEEFEIRVLDGEYNTVVADPGFKYDVKVLLRQAQAQEEDGELRAVAADDAQYYTMLTLPAEKASGHYIVKVMAKGVKAADGSDLALMHYDIMFLDNIESKDLPTYSQLYAKDANGGSPYLEAQEEYLEEEYGETEFKIDFDQFFKLNLLPNSDPLKRKTVSYGVTGFGGDYESHSGKSNFCMFSRNSDFRGEGGGLQHAWYKWPVAWHKSTYSFGYNYRYNYGMYMLATHSENVPFHAAADMAHPGEGLYDILYYKTKRLRESNPKIKQQQGYFYYVNAASDPGVSARLDFTIPCPGYRVIVSAWVAELTAFGDARDESANVEINIVAAMKDGERITLHEYISGYVPKDGQWHHIFYSFVPQISEFFTKDLTFADVDHFELELSHNGISSVGADYAIDDIRAYVAPPYAEVTQESAACDDAATQLALNVKINYEAFMGRIGKYDETDAGHQEDITLHYAFVDKDLADRSPQPDAVVAAFPGKNPYATVTLKNGYRFHDRWNDIGQPGKDSEAQLGKPYRLTTEDGDHLLTWISATAGGALRPGKQYYVVFRSGELDAPGSTGKELMEFFNPLQDCAYCCLMTVEPSLKIKIDGVVQPKFADIKVCENQSPAIQVNLLDLNTNELVQEDAFFDWFYGTLNEYESYSEADGEGALLFLKDALKAFREAYPRALDVLNPGEPEADIEVEPWMLALIDKACSETRDGIPLLTLHQESFVMPPVELPDGTQSAAVRCVAIPTGHLDEAVGTHVVCAAPTEISVNVGYRTPRLLHGLPQIPYPDDLADVPLRIGLHQFSDSETGASRLTFTPIHIPVRLAESTDGKHRQFGVKRTRSDNTEVVGEADLLLVQTDDPAYRHLGGMADDLLSIGTISSFAADTDKGAANSFVAQFDQSAIQFKEGYFYRMRFQFEEDLDSEVEADDARVCSGQDVFTLKIVPQYLQWTGRRNLSWDNDANWRRIPSDSLLLASADAARSHCLTDGAAGNTSARAFAPLDFTKVIIGAPAVGKDGEISGENPWLYAPSAELSSVNDFYDADMSHHWTSNPGAGDSPAGQEPGPNIGQPTELIQYDMTAYAAKCSGIDEVHCRPWSANACSEVHFKTGATLMNQQQLSYRKAWVDMELDHSRWYLASSPMKHLYAGDFYLPTDGARQKTELFSDITFSDALCHRFRPAVYQRSWDKGEAKVYVFGEDGARNAAVRTFWSHVYNDVEEEYGAGAAFSIKTDVSLASNVGEADRVLFRFPKADTEYWYYKDGYAGEADAKGHLAANLDRTDAGKLALCGETLTTSLTTDSEGNWFLAGNPFMTHLDMRKFLEKNPSLERKYWLITETGHIAVSFSDDWTATASEGSDMSDFTALPPMQGFFVRKAGTATRTITLTYDASMMRRYDAASRLLTGLTRSAADSPALRIAAFVDGKQVSSAALAIGVRGSDAECMDHRDLDLPASVFTAKCGRALAVNFTDEAEATEIGVLADAGTRTLLRFSGTEAVSGLCLLDKADSTITPLFDGMEIETVGTTSGRYFLTSGVSTEIASEALTWAMEGGVLTLRRPKADASMSVRVCDTLGRVVASATTQGTELSIPITQGVFIAEINCGSYRRTLKINR